jgi:polar amino acid transport system substrate-binding protein
VDRCRYACGAVRRSIGSDTAPDGPPDARFDRMVAVYERGWSARFALDLVETALGRFGVNSKTTIVSAADFTPALLGSRFDGSAAAWKDPERERLLVFSQPYLENRLVLVGRRGADVSAKELADLKGKNVAIVGGSSYGGVIERAGPVLVRSSSDEDSLSRLLKNGDEYALMDELFAVRRARTDASTIIARFNAQLRDMIADRTYHRLLHVDWIRADINGDVSSNWCR